MFSFETDLDAEIGSYSGSQASVNTMSTNNENDQIVQTVEVEPIRPLSQFRELSNHDIVAFINDANLTDQPSAHVDGSTDEEILQFLQEFLDMSRPPTPPVYNVSTDNTSDSFNSNPQQINQIFNSVNDQILNNQPTVERQVQIEIDQTRPDRFAIINTSYFKSMIMKISASTVEKCG